MLLGLLFAAWRPSLDSSACWREAIVESFVKFGSIVSQLALGRPETTSAPPGGSAGPGPVQFILAPTCPPYGREPAGADCVIHLVRLAHGGSAGGRRHRSRESRSELDAPNCVTNCRIGVQSAK